MSDHHLNLFRPYSSGKNDEMAVTRAFVIACMKSPHGQKLFRQALQKASEDFSPVDADGKWGWELETPAGKIHERCQGNEKEKFVLTITPCAKMEKAPWWTMFHQQRSEVERLVPEEAEVPKTEGAFSKFLRKNCRAARKHYDEDADHYARSTLLSAFWDVHRWLWKHARPDAVVEGKNFVCLIESKIYGPVGENQVQNHKEKAFGEGSACSLDAHIRWQDVHDLCQEE